MQEPLLKAYDSYKHVLGDYHRLISSVELSDEDAERMDKILEQAESDEVLNFLLGEVNYIIGQRFGLFDNQNINEYKNQQAYLREHLEHIPNVLDWNRERQKELRKRGFYRGPIDGIFGQDSRMAVKIFQENSNLQVSGIIDNETYLKLTHRNSTSQRPGE
jgi:Putative peptidoglycan binding domain